MAEAIVADLAAGLIRKLVSLATNEVIQAWKLREDLETLHERFELVGALLDDAHTKKLIMSTAKLWFNKLEDVARVAQAFMDQLEYQVTSTKVEKRRKVRDLFIPSKNTLLFRFRVARKIKYINASFDKICKWATDIGLKPVEHLISTVQHREIRNTTPCEDESLIVGRDKDASYLVNVLCKKNDEGLQVNAILGIGGQGKTTLARMIYNKDVVVNMFPKRMWVTVSDDFDFMKILNQMVVSLTLKPSVLENAEGLIKNLQEKIKSEKFLLVLDDVWNEKPEEWEKLRNALLGVGGARGSNILVTTRKQEVIHAMRCSDPYQMEKLSEEDSWELFKQRAFSNGGVLETEAFVTMGKRMVKRCGGLPLAIKTLGSLLYSKKTEQQWLHIQNSETWKSEGVLSSLRLSYDNLPYSALKRCFAYFSILPKDSDIYKDELIQTWTALGFLSRDGNVSMEDIGNEYFDFLLCNSLLQDAEKDIFGNVTECKMHDLVHDLALDVSSNYSATIKPSHDFNKVSKAIHIRLEGFKDVKPNVFDEAHFDTVQALYAEACIFNVILPNLRHLRVLVLHSFVKELPSSIGNLKNLKYLDISDTLDYKTSYKLPNYITRLYNLQTLRIGWTHELPENVCNLINLRHLVIQNPRSRYMFNGMERLTSLQTLPYFVVSRDENGLVGQLGGLKNLRGKLRLYDLNEVANIEEARKAKVCEKPGVEQLLFKWKKNEDEREDNDEEVMEGLRPHPNLKGLRIEDFMGKKFATWMTMMTNLVKITLRDCKKCQVLPPLGHLPKLKVMKIRGMENVKVIGKELSGVVESGSPEAVTTTTTTLYPSLIQVYLDNMPELEEWVEGGGVMSRGDNDAHTVFPKLEDLTIYECPRLRKIPNSCFPSLNMLRIVNMESNMILETMSTNVETSLTSLALKNIGDSSSSSTCSSSGSSSNIESIINLLLRNNSPSLTQLHLEDCKGLKHLTLGVSLVDFCVYNCTQVISINNLVEVSSLALKHLEIGGIPSSHIQGVFAHIQTSTLERLGLGPFYSDEEEFPWPFSSSSSSSLSNSFPNLLELHLNGWEKVKSITLFDQLHLSPIFPALTQLIIRDFIGVKGLPDSIANLPSLKTLYIQNCENLETLPMFDHSHPLKQLEINGCPIAKERYSKGSGPQWFKIQHIQHVMFDFEPVQYNPPTL